MFNGTDDRESGWNGADGDGYGESGLSGLAVLTK